MVRVEVEEWWSGQKVDELREGIAALIEDAYERGRREGIKQRWRQVLRRKKRN